MLQGLTDALHEPRKVIRGQLEDATSLLNREELEDREARTKCVTVVARDVCGLRL